MIQPFHSVVARRRIAGGGGGNPFLTSGGSTSQNDFSAWLGYSFTVGGSPLNVTDLGYDVVSGSTQTHEVTIRRTNNEEVANVTINANGNSGFTYLAETATLSASTEYYIAVRFESGGDNWRSEFTPTTASGATIGQPIYSIDGSSWIPGGSAGNVYAGPNFKFTI